MNRDLFIITMLTILCFSCMQPERQNCPPSNEISGAWSVQSIKWIYPDTTYHLKKPEPGFLHFTTNRYSFIWTPSDEKRVPFELLSQPTAEEMQAGFRSIVLNAGTYTKTDSTISVVAEIAKVPGFEGGSQVFEYQLRGDTLLYTMVDETYPNGDKPRWYGSMRTEFKLARIQE